MKQLRPIFLTFLLFLIAANSYGFVVNESVLVINNSPDISLEIQEEFSFKINPNPATDFLNVSLSSLGTDGVIIEVFDVLGKRILKQNLSEIQSSISVSDWKSGLYLVRVSGKEFSQTKRFLKR